MTAPRRTGRQRKANPKYQNDGWDEETLRILRDSSESAGSSPADASNLIDLQKPGAPQDTLNERDVGEEVILPSGSAQSSDTEAADEEDDSVSVASDSDAPRDSGLFSKARFFSTAPGDNVHSRGLALTKDLAKATAYPSTFGPGVEDLSDVIRARDLWLKARDITLPSRQTLLVATKPLTAWAVDERTTKTDPEPDPILPPSTSANPLHNQILCPLNEIELRRKYLARTKPPHAVVLGPWGQQRKYTLDHLSTLDIGEAWLKPEAQEDTHAPGQVDPISRYHEGWLLNIGQRAQSLAWAPCRGYLQYLAIAVACSEEQRRMAPSAKKERPAFHPSPAYPSSIQIWAFDTKTTRNGDIRTLAMDQKPTLAFLLATEWGNILQLKWRPAYPETQVDAASDGPVFEYLGIVSTDGQARLVAVPLQSKAGSKDSTSFLHVLQTAITVTRPANSIFTSLTFASPTDLILGTSDGSVYLYDLSAQSEPTLKSYMEHRLLRTYIMGLSTASPGPHSTFIAASSASGDFVLTDLRSPEQDSVHVVRSCFPHRDLIYAPFTRSFITILDSTGNAQTDRNGNTFLVCHHIRRFPTTLKLAKLPLQSGTATALAGSQWHPCILVGNAKGQVFATNYLRKVLPHRRTDHKKGDGAYLQKVCEYDWRSMAGEELDGAIHSQDGPTGQAREIDIYHGRDARDGVSRFQEGFKPERIEVGNPPPTTKAKKVKTKTEESGAGEAIFEEEQAVTAIEWNENATCAGFVAVGWGSGIVRVQDMAYDAEDK